jgi:hypothetical protein
MRRSKRHVPCFAPMVLQIRITTIAMEDGRVAHDIPRIEPISREEER